MSTQVLLIDDAPDFLDLLERLVLANVPDSKVTRLDPNAVGLSDSGFGLQHFDVVLLDYDLGGAGDGIEWLRSVKCGADFPPTVVITANSDPYVAARAIKAGACEYLAKPDVGGKQVAAVIREALNSARAAAPGAGEGCNADTTTLRASSGTIAAMLPEADRTIALPRGVAMGAHRAESVSVRGYSIEYKLGEGATARVFLARQVKSGRVVVLKIVTPELMEDNEFLERFLQEAELATGIDSPHVVRIHEQAFTDDGGFIAMEHLPGGDLRSAIKRGLDPGVAIENFRQIALGLSSIHAVGIVHRDLKPANVMLREDGTLALVDFGISKQSGASELTQVGAILGTPYYMSPEQARGFAIDPRSDLYAAGIILFEMLTGKRAIDAAGPAELLYQHAFGERPALPEPFSHYQPLMQRMLAIDPAQRPASATEMLTEFDALTEGGR